MALIVFPTRARGMKNPEVYYRRSRLLVEQDRGVTADSGRNWR